MIEPMDEKKIIRKVSDRIVEAQSPILILDAIKWDNSVKQAFLDSKCKEPPKIDESYYAKFPLPYDCEEKISEFTQIIADIKSELGQFHGLGNIMVHMCGEYILACQMLAARGTKKFGEIAVQLYGSPEDAFYPGGPKLKELSTTLRQTIDNLEMEIHTDLDEKKYTAEEAVTKLQKKLSTYFQDPNMFKVMVSDDIVADAAAGANIIRLKSDVMFSERDVHYLEVHEGWTHVGTTINGSLQPVCTFLSKGSPSSAITQEGLAVITEVFTFSSNPRRMKRIISRLEALDKVSQGANFLDIFQFFLDHGFDESQSYAYSMRVFRGGNTTDDSKPFTKDLSYTKGFLLIYNYIRLATQAGVLSNIPLLFLGKTLLKDLPVLAEYLEQGIIVPPKFVPPQFSDLAALSAWMAFSLFLNKFDVDKMALNYKDILR